MLNLCFCRNTFNILIVHSLVLYKEHCSIQIRKKNFLICILQCSQKSNQSLYDINILFNTKN